MSFTVKGGNRLSGSVKIAGNKNEALPLVAAALLCNRMVVLRNIPDIGDVRGMLDIAAQLGAVMSPLTEGCVTLATPKIATSTLPLGLSSKIRGSILFASSLLARTGRAVIPQPGGDTIGRRRLDTHFLVFEELGAKLSTAILLNNEDGLNHHCYVLEAPKGLKGADIHLDEASVTGTENALIAAAGAQGITRISNAACEPHVQGLCHFLQKMGVTVEGVGSNVLTVHGRQSFSDADHTCGCDHIEAGSFISLAACTGSELTLSNVDTDHMRMTLLQFNRLGVNSVPDHAARTISIPANQSMEIRRDLGSAIPRIEDATWPGFPADLTSIMVVAATQAKGMCLIHEKLFESRLFFVDTLIGMGAQIVLCDPHRVVVAGPSKLYGSRISSPDIRAGMALLIAALAAEGTSVIHNISQIDRGYENIDTRLKALGADIERNIQQRRHSDTPI